MYTKDASLRDLTSPGSQFTGLGAQSCSKLTHKRGIERMAVMKQHMREQGEQWGDRFD